MKKRIIGLAVLFILGSNTQVLAIPSTHVATYANGGSNIGSPSLGDSDRQTSNSGAPLTSYSSAIDSNENRTITAIASANVQAGSIRLYASGSTSAHDNLPISYVSASSYGCHRHLV